MNSEIWWKKIASCFQRGSATRDIATLTVGTTLAQGITIAVTPLLTRLYTPSDFGLLAVFLAVASVSATLITLRYETSILVPNKNVESANLVLLSLILGIGLSLVLAVLGALLPIVWQEKFGLGALGYWISIAFLTAAATSILATMQGWVNRRKQYRHMAWLRVGQSATLASLAVLFGFLNINNGLLIAQITASACLCLVALWFGRSVTRLWQKQQLKATALAHKNAPKYLLPTALLDVITMQMPVLLIAAWFGADDAGQFSMAWRLMMMPMAVIGGAVGQVFMQRFSKALETPVLAKKIIKQSWIFLFAVGFIPFTLIFIGGDAIFMMVLGAKWQDSGVLAMMLAPMALAMFISSPTSYAYVLLGLQKYSLLFGVITFIYRPLCIFLGKYFNSLTLGLWIWVLLEVIVIFIYQYLVWRKLND